MAKGRIILIIVICVLVACRKDQAPDNNYEYIYPESYYPVYPGSSWNYIDIDSSTSTTAVQPEWQLHRYLLKSNPEVYSVPVYVPVLNNTCIYGYEYYTTDFTNYGAPFMPILSEHLGYSWVSHWTNNMFGGYYAFGHSAVDSSLYTVTVPAGTFNNVIRVNVKNYVGGTYQYIYHYYANGVGEVMSEIYFDTVLTHRHQLTSYFINN